MRVSAHLTSSLHANKGCDLRCKVNDDELASIACLFVNRFELFGIRQLANNIATTGKPEQRAESPLLRSLARAR